MEIERLSDLYPDHRADVVTTVDPTELMASGRDALAGEVVSWVESKYGHCSLGLFTDLEGARSILATADKGAALAQIVLRGGLIAEPVPPVLRTFLFAS